MNNLIFVYGTLKKNFGNHSVMGESTFLGKFITPAKYTMLSCGGFPAVTLNGNTAIHGEVYNVTSEKDLARIFRLEGYSGIKDSPENWYDVEEVETPYGIAQMFVWKNNKYDLEIVKTGIWNK